MTCSPLEGASWKRLQPESNTKSALQNQRRPLVAQAFRPANGRRAALKGCATSNVATRFNLTSVLVRICESRDARRFEAKLRCKPSRHLHNSFISGCDTRC